jgi:hypothetical protein
MITVELRPARANQYVTRARVAEGRLPMRDCTPPDAQTAVWWITLGIRPAPNRSADGRESPGLGDFPDNPARSGPSPRAMPDPFRPVKAELYILSNFG